MIARNGLCSGGAPSTGGAACRDLPRRERSSGVARSCDQRRGRPSRQQNQTVACSE